MKRKIITTCGAAALAAALLLSQTACGAGSVTVTKYTGASAVETAAYVQTAASTYSAADAITFTFSDSGITASASGGYKLEGTALTIQSAGTYILTGSCADGSVTVKKGTTGVTLVLNGLDLTSSDTAPIACNKSTEVTIFAAAGSVNRLTDSAQNNDDNYPDNENAENAVIKCKDGSAVTLCGTGTVYVTANGKNGIKSGATTEEEGEASLTIRELTLVIDAPVNDAINAEQTLNIESGCLTISAGDDAVHSDYVLNVGADGTAGPTIDITACYEGLEAATLNVYSGDISILATDDCLNAANSDLTGYAFSMNISGGSIYAYTTAGDGFDSNGSLTISGGTVVVFSANTADNQPLDADGAVSITGGTVLAAGGSNGMGLSLTANQPCVSFGTSGGMGGGMISSLVTRGSTLSVRDASGNVLYSVEAPCNVSYALFSGAALSAGSSYSLYSGSTAAASSTAQSGSVSGGGQQPGQPGSGQNPGEQQPGNGQQRPGNGGQAPGSGQNPGQNPGGGQQPAAPGSFSDVSESDWFYSAVQYVSEQGLMTGTGSGMFSPNEEITRGMLVTILYRLSGEPAVSESAPFADVETGSYYEKAVAWAAACGIVSGYENGSFGPNDAVTREQLAAILYRYARYQGQDVSASADLSGFADAGAVSGYAQPALAWASGSGLIVGTTDGTLDPQGTATRAQAATILMRFCQTEI